MPLQHAEGPHWDAEKQLLYFVDIAGNRVYQYDPYSKKLTYANIGNHICTYVTVYKGIFDES